MWWRILVPSPVTCGGARRYRCEDLVRPGNCLPRLREKARHIHARILELRKLEVECSFGNTDHCAVKDAWLRREARQFREASSEKRHPKCLV